MIEWFTPGTEPQAPDHWQIAGRINLPPEYAEWSRQEERREQIAVQHAVADTANRALRILSPLNGDRYESPPGVAAHYISIPLLATNANDVRWSVDGKPIANHRWRIAKGTHLIEARWSSGARDTVTVVVQ